MKVLVYFIAVTFSSLIYIRRNISINFDMFKYICGTHLSIIGRQTANFAHYTFACILNLTDEKKGGGAETLNIEDCRTTKQSRTP